MQHIGNPRSRLTNRADYKLDVKSTKAHWMMGHIYAKQIKVKSENRGDVTEHVQKTHEERKKRGRGGRTERERERGMKE